MAKKSNGAVQTVADQQNAFVNQLHTDSVLAKIAKLGGLVGDTTTYVKLIGDEIYTNGGRYSHYVSVDGATAMDKALTAELMRQWKEEFRKNLNGYAKEMSAYLMDKKVFSAMVDGEEKEATRKDRNRVSNVLSKWYGDFTNHLAFLEGIVIEKKPRKSKDEGEGESIEPTPTEKTPRQQVLDDLMNAIRHARKDNDVPDHIITGLTMMIAELGGSVESD